MLLQHILLEGGYWNTWTFSLTQFRPSYVPMTINNKSQAICCCTRKGWRPPCTQTLQLSYLQLKGGESLLHDRRISGQPLSYTASCKTASAAATQHAASVSSCAVERTPQGKVDFFPCLFMNICESSTVSRKADNITSKMGRQTALVPWTWEVGGSGGGVGNL